MLSRRGLSSSIVVSSLCTFALLGCRDPEQVAPVGSETLSPSETGTETETETETETTNGNSDSATGDTLGEVTGSDDLDVAFKIDGVWNGKIVLALHTSDKNPDEADTDGDRVGWWKSESLRVDKTDDGYTCILGRNPETSCSFDGTPESFSVVINTEETTGSKSFPIERKFQYEIQSVGAMDGKTMEITYSLRSEVKFGDEDDASWFAHSGQGLLTRLEQNEEETSKGLKLIGEFDDFDIKQDDPTKVLGQAANVRVDGDYAYVVRFGSGLSVLDISKPADIVEIASVTAEDVGGDYFNDVKLKHVGDKLYALVSDDMLGLVSFDVTDPTTPEVVSTFDLGSNVMPDFSDWDFPVDDTTGGTGDTTATTSTTSTTSTTGEPEDPFEDIVFPTGLNNHTAFIEGDIAYLTVSNSTVFFDETGADRLSGGLLMLDVSDPANPIELGRWLTSTMGAFEDEAHDLYVKDGIVYLCAWDTGMVILDTTVPAEISVVGHYKYDEFMTSHSVWVTQIDGRLVAAHGGEAYDAHIRMVDVDPDSPTFLEEIGSFQTRPEVSVHNLMVIGNEVVASYYQDGIRIVDIKDPENPKQVAWYNTYEGAQNERAGYTIYEGAIGQDVVGNRIYVADTLRGLLILERE